MASQMLGVTADPGIQLEALPLHLFMHCPHNSLPSKTLISYSRTATLTESMKVPGHPDPGGDPNDTSEHAVIPSLDTKLVLRRSFRLICILHRLGLTLKGKFTGNELIVDSCLDVKLYGIHLSRFTRSDGDLDYNQFIWVVEEGVFKGNVPVGISQWLKLMGRGIASYEYLLCYHVSLMELNQGVECFLSLYSKFVDLKRTDLALYWDIVSWLDKFVGWKTKRGCVNYLLRASLAFRKPDGKRVFYHDDVRGALKLCRDCLVHPAKRFRALFTLVMADGFAQLLSDFQEAMYDAGLLQSLRLDTTMM